MSEELNLNNKYRVLLTEVLPYELPLMLDNEGFYQNMQDKDLFDVFKEVFQGKMKEWTIPFDYSIHKYGGGKSRKLSLIHPLTQLECADFYENHDYYMLSLCGNSPFSIRHIANRAKCIFKAEEDKSQNDQQQPNQIEVQDDGIEKRFRSYFSYKQYDMMYKFFSSGDYLRLEQKFSHQMTIDIASCFYNIYTHTIAWAVKGKEQAKDLIGKTTFENCFDKLMQHSNYNETNGIVVGPEISRIFAEVILQRIDVNVLNRLKQSPYSLKLGRDYEVRRYVDDHFIYANSEDVLHKILEVYKEEFQVYKLYVNDSKLVISKRPFVTTLSDAKSEINNLVSKIYNKVLEKKDDGSYKHTVQNEIKVFQSIVNDFRSIAHRYNQNYGSLNRYFLTLLRSQIENEVRDKHSVTATPELLLMYVEVAFYVFSLDMNVSASIKLCRILNCLHVWAGNCTDNTILPELESRIYREVKRCLDIYKNNRKNGETNIEALNLILVLSRMMESPIQSTQLVRLFNITSGNPKEYEHLNYFQICTLLYIIGKDAEYEEIRKMVVGEINRRLSKDCALWHADNALLFFDTMVCPYVEQKEVKQLIIKIFRCKECDYGNKYKKMNKTKRWFFDWDKTHNLYELLSKKEYHSSYE